MTLRFLKTLVLLFISGHTLMSQTTDRPNYALKSHPTLEILKIELTARAAIFHMSVENRIEGGNFCADRNITLVFADGTKSLMTASEGIPACPDAYRFKQVGEKLDFRLVFPPLKEGTNSVDLVENCSESCFSFYGIVLGNDLNRRIDDAFAYAERNEPSAAVVNLVRLSSAGGKSNQAVEAILCLNIIKLSVQTGNRVRAEEWYKRLGNSGITETPRYISHLKSQGISF